MGITYNGVISYVGETEISEKEYLHLICGKIEGIHGIVIFIA